MNDEKNLGRTGYALEYTPADVAAQFAFDEEAQDTLAKVSTKALCAELEKRDGVHFASSFAMDGSKVTVSACPPCTVFIVVD